MKSKKNIYIVIGTRAQLIKVAPILIELDNNEVPYTFIYTAQHKETIDELIADFKIKSPDITLFNPKETKSIGLFGIWFLKAFWILLTQHRKIISSPGLIITHGDTISCIWGALLGKISKSKVLHLESGLRSFNIFHPFPEELSRLITFSLTDIYACPNKWAINNLKKYKGIKINTKANTLINSVEIAINSKNNIPEINLPKKYVVASIHRFEHVFNKKRFKKIINMLIYTSKIYPVIFIMHPVTKKQLITYDLYHYLANQPNIILSKRLSFLKFICLLNKSEFVMTDGGSNQEELSYMGIPTAILRKSTERTEGLDKNAVLINNGFEQFKKFVTNYKKYKTKHKISRYNPSKIVVDWIIKNYLN